MNLKAFIENRILEQLAEDENPIENTRNSFSSLLNERKISGGLGIDMIPRISDDIKDTFEAAGFERATSKTGQNTFNFSGGDMEGLEELLKVLGYRKSRNNVMLPRNNKVESEHGVAEVGFFGSKVRLTVSASMKEAKDDYQIYHKTFSSAVQHAIQQVEKRGYEVDEEDWDRKVALGPRKPSSGKTNSYTIDLMKNGKETKRKLQMQVYYDEGRYELNMYIS